MSCLPEPPDSPFYTTAEVAHILRCSIRTVQNMIQAGRLPAAIIGRHRYRIPKHALNAMIHPKEAEPACDGISQDPWRVGPI